MTIHSFIGRNVDVDFNFNLYEDENTVIYYDDDHISFNLDSSRILKAVSSS